MATTVARKDGATMTREEAINKAEKLIAMVNGAATPEEAAAASLALQRLLAKNNLTMHEVSEGAASDEDEKVGEYTAHDGRPVHGWEARIACTVSKNFRCGVYTSKSRWCKNQQVVFYGAGDDAKNAGHLFAALVGAAKNCWADYRVKAKECMALYGYEWNAREHRGEYLDGFAEGIDDAFRKQTERDAGCAIMLVKPEAVKKYEREELHLSHSTAHYAYHGRGSSYGSGRRDGRSVGSGHAVRA